MAEWTPRLIVDQDVEHPYRYDLADPETGQIVGTYDILPVREAGDVEGTPVDAAYLQPIEDYLKAVEGDVAELAQRIVDAGRALDGVVVTINLRIGAVEQGFNAKIAASDAQIAGVDQRVAAANARMDGINTTMGTLAPKSNPVLTNPTANTVPVTTNSTNLATTAAVKTYLDGLMAAYGS